MDKWHTGSEHKVCENCSWVGNEGYKIAIHPDVLAVAFHLCKEIETEWQMLLSGSIDGKMVRCTGYYIPNQEVTHSTVKNLEAIDKAFIDEHEIVATIHSHANMGVFFSNVDDEFTNMNWIKHHVVVNNTHEFAAKSRHDLPCSGVKFVNSFVETMIASNPNVEGKERITKYEYKYPATMGGFSTGDHVPAYDRGDDYTPGQRYWEKDNWCAWSQQRYQKVNGVWKYVGIGTH